MRVLVTGAAGFVGSRLCRRLLSDGHAVFGMDNLLTGRMDNLKELPAGGSFSLLRCDVTEYIDLPEPVERVYHLASPASPPDYLRFPVETLMANSLGTRNALGAARRWGARFLLASTSEVYGDPKVHPQPESYWGNVNPVGPRSVYDESKRFGESLTVAYHAVHCVDTHIARIFNTFGPRMRSDDGRAIPEFITHALLGEPLAVHGDGKQTRSFCFVDDTVEGLVALMESDYAWPVNIGGTAEMSVLDLARRIVELVGSSSEIVHVDRPVDDPQVREPDISLASRLLDWKPRTTFEDGMAQTIEWFRGLTIRQERGEQGGK